MYAIETKFNDQWTMDGIGEPNQFECEDDALAAICGLRELGGDWKYAEYRVVEIKGDQA